MLTTRRKYSQTGCVRKKYKNSLASYEVINFVNVIRPFKFRKFRIRLNEQIIASEIVSERVPTNKHRPRKCVIDVLYIEMPRQTKHTSSSANEAKLTSESNLLSFVCLLWNFTKKLLNRWTQSRIESRLKGFDKQFLVVSFRWLKFQFSPIYHIEKFVLKVTTRLLFFSMKEFNFERNCLQLYIQQVQWATIH